MSVIDNLTDANFLILAAAPQIQNDVDTNTSTSTNHVSEESTGQSRGSCLKSLSDIKTQKSLCSSGRPKRPRAQPRRFKKSFIYKSGQRLLKFRLNEISNRQLVRTVGTQIDSSGLAETELNAEDVGAENSIKSRSDFNEAVGKQNQDSTLDLDSIKKELRRQQWRESNKRLRSAYLADPESKKRRNKRLQDQRERTSLAYKKLTESEKMEARRKHQVYKAQRLRNETNNQRFWRLIKGRQFRKNGYDNNAILLRYDKSLGLYGLTKPTFPNCSSPDDKFVEDQIYRFNYILKKVLAGSPIPEELFQTFAERGIDLPKHFFTDFVRDQEQVESEV